MLRTLRKFFRRRMKPMPVTAAANKKEMLSLLYMFVAWNAFCITGYHFLKSDRPANKDSTGKAWAQYLGLHSSTVTIHSFNGLSKASVEVLKEGDVKE